MPNKTKSPAASEAENKKLLKGILPHLDRSGVLDSRFPDKRGEYWAHCPYHSDQNPTNFSVSSTKFTFNCFACGAKGHIDELARHLNLEIPSTFKWSKTIQEGAFERDSASETGKSGMFKRSNEKQGSTPPPPLTIPPLTLEEYAKEKELPVKYLKSLGLKTQKYPVRQDKQQEVVVIPYYNEEGQEDGRRYRLMMQKTSPDMRFRWKSGTKVKQIGLYGRWKLDKIREKSWCILVEGESDTQTLWHHGIPAMGVAGSNIWNSEWADYFEGVEVYLWVEPDAGGEALLKAVGSSIKQLRIIRPPTEIKDVSDAHLAGKDISSLVNKLKENVPLLSEIKKARESARAEEYWKKAENLLKNGPILPRVGEIVRELGLVNEDQIAKLLYLALTSRVLERELDRPVSVVIKGPSAGGKSFMVETVLKLFPEEAYRALTAMSEKALIYSDVPLSHKHLIIFEAEGLNTDFGNYAIRSLLSEGHIKYETVEKTRDGMVPREIYIPGPTGLVMTTTRTSLHPENETRMLSVNISDKQEQTKAVYKSLAKKYSDKQDEDFEEKLEHWRSLQSWLSLGGVHEVIIPFAAQLAELANPAEVRLRRDFSTVLALVASHALLHQQQRNTNKDGRVIATVDDYAAVHELIHTYLAEAAGLEVSPVVKETVKAVETLLRQDRSKEVVQAGDIYREMGVKSSTGNYRLKQAIAAGYLVNTETRPRQPAQIKLGNEVPTPSPVIPTPEDLERDLGTRGESKPIRDELQRSNYDQEKPHERKVGSNGDNQNETEPTERTRQETVQSVSATDLSFEDMVDYLDDE